MGTDGFLKSREIPEAVSRLCLAAQIRRKEIGDGVLYWVALIAVFAVEGSLHHFNVVLFVNGKGQRAFAKWTGQDIK